MSDNGTDKTTGRTPWDFATVALMRLGPATVVVVGFIGLAGFLYTEIDEARLKADQQLRDSLESAQAQLVENTSKMGEMSKMLIENISNMLELGERVDSKIAKVRVETETLADALKKAKIQVKEAQAQIGDRAAELDRNIKEIKDLEDKRKNLAVEISQLRSEKKKFTIQGSEYARKVGELKEENAVLASVEDFTLWADKVANQGGGLEERPDLSLADVIDRVRTERITISDIFPAFAKDPGSADTRKKLGELIGLRESILEGVIGEDGAGFSTWFYFKNISTGAKNIFGYVEQEPDGPRGILKIKVQGGRVSLVEPWAANVLFKIPTAENWYDTWMCDLFFDYENEISDIYYDAKIDKWNALKSTLPAAPDGIYEKGVVYEMGVLYGYLKDFETGTIEEFRKQFPEQYGRWSQRIDAFGRPRLILSMLERAKTFDATKIAGMRSATFPDGLQDFAIEVLNASVSVDDVFLKSGVVGPEVTRKDLGGIAAMALREGLRVERVGQRQSAEQLVAAAEDFEILFSVEAVDPAQERREARLTFSRAGERWNLSAFSALF